MTMLADNTLATAIRRCKKVYRSLTITGVGMLVLYMVFFSLLFTDWAWERFPSYYAWPRIVNTFLLTGGINLAMQGFFQRLRWRSVYRSPDPLSADFKEFIMVYGWPDLWPHTLRLTGLAAVYTALAALLWWLGVLIIPQLQGWWWIFLAVGFAIGVVQAARFNQRQVGKVEQWYQEQFGV